MRIGLDGYNLAMPHGTGIATYGFVLARTLQAMGHQVEGVFGLAVGDSATAREVMFYDRLVHPGPAKRGPGPRWLDAARLTPVARAQDVPLTGRVVTAGLDDWFPRFDRLVTSPRLFERAHAHFRLTGRFKTLRMRRPPEIMHWTYPVPIRLAGARNVYTLHDLVPLRLPYATLDQKRHYRALVGQVAREAEHLCTVSEASRTDIIAEFAVDPARITNTYQASPIEPRWTAGDGDDDARLVESAFGLERDRYFLYFGAIEPKKNVGRLIAAYFSLETDCPLVVVGGRAWQAEADLALLPPDGVGPTSGKGILKLGYLPRRTLLALVRGARAVAFPSLYEGFGLPVHEAMLLGTPVLSSRTGAIPEIAGDAAILIDPYSVDDIAGGLARLDRDAPLRADLAVRGKVQAAAFSQAAYQSRLEAMYARIQAAGQ